MVLIYLAYWQQVISVDAALAVSIGIDRALQRRGWRFWRRSTPQVEHQPHSISGLQDYQVQDKLQAQTQTKACIQTHSGVRTQVHDLSRTFAAVCEEQRDEIDTAQLLDALRKAEEALRRAGQRTNAKDLSNNIKKIEAAYGQAPTGVRETMASLLKYEKDLGVHEAPGNLSDKSAAMGLLWIRRNLSFQHHLYSSVLNGKAPKEAAVEAYRNELEPFHGWTLRKISTLALKNTSMDGKHELLAQLSGLDENEFGPAHEAAAEEELSHLVSVWQPVSCVVNLVFCCWHCNISPLFPLFRTFIIVTMEVETSLSSIGAGGHQKSVNNHPCHAWLSKQEVHTDRFACVLKNQIT